MAPLLVHLGVLPEVTSAVNAFMILFTSSSNVEHYADLGILQLYGDTVTLPGYIIFAVLIGFVGALCGRLLATRWVKGAKHPSFLVFLLGGVLSLSATLLVTRLVHQRAQKEAGIIKKEDMSCTFMSALDMNSMQG